MELSLQISKHPNVMYQPFSLGRLKPARSKLENLFKVCGWLESRAGNESHRAEGILLQTRMLRKVQKHFEFSNKCRPYVPKLGLHVFGKLSVVFGKLFQNNHTKTLQARCALGVPSRGACNFVCLLLSWKTRVFVLFAGKV